MKEDGKKSVLKLYGIKNCDTLKKARHYLESQGVDYQFHDYRADGLSAALLQTFIDKLGYETLLNTRGTTWRRLPEAERAAINNAAAAQQLMLQYPAIIKRPLLIAADGSMLPGFSIATYAQFIQEKS